MENTRNFDANHEVEKETGEEAMEEEEEEDARGEVADGGGGTGKLVPAVGVVRIASGEVGFDWFGVVDRLVNE